MPPSPAYHVFSSVKVGLPSKVRGSEAEEEWQEVDLKWNTGELTVHLSSYSLVFQPEKQGSDSIPMGQLIRASAAVPDERVTMVVTTSQNKDGQMRMTFQSARDAAEFARMAEAAEAAHIDKKAKHLTPFKDEAVSKLVAEIEDAFKGRWPLIFPRAELHGPVAGRESEGSAILQHEALLGRGAAVLLDPAPLEERNKDKGSYELIIFGEDEGVRAPMKRIPIAHRMSLEKQPTDLIQNAPAACFTLSAPLHGLAQHTITFDSAAVGAAFARDFRVRQRLLEVSVKTVKGKNARAELQAEIKDLQQRTLSARLRRLMLFLIVVAIVAFLARLGFLYQEDGGAQEVGVYVHATMDDAQAILRVSRTFVWNAGSHACRMVGAVPSEEVQRCVALAEQEAEASTVKQCIQSLVLQ